MSSPAFAIFDPEIEPRDDVAYYDGFLSEGDIAVWLGREKHRKTNVLLQLAISAALGKTFLKFRFVGVAPLKVVYIDYESKASSLKRRYDALSTAMKLTPEERALLKSNLTIILIREMQRSGNPVPRFPVGTPSRGKEAEHKAATKYWQDLVAKYPAQIYVIDPMRCLHSQDENDSLIEQLLSDVRTFFHGAAVIIAHHLRKKGDLTWALKSNLREWSEAARGSGAIKAHADVIVCQERVIEDSETVYLGAFLKDAPDIEPIPLEESDHESFFWEVRPEIPTHLRHSYEALKTSGGKFSSKNAMVSVLKGAKVKQGTAYRHIQELVNRGLLVERCGQWELETV